MARYRKVDTRIWSDGKFMALPRDSQFVFLFLLTHPLMTSLGAMRATLDGLAAELRWDHAGFRKAFSKLTDETGAGESMVIFDENSNCLVLKNFLRYNPPENPNVVKSWARVLDFIPESPLKPSIICTAESLCAGLSRRFREAFRKAFGKEPQTVSEPLRAPMDVQEPLALSPKPLALSPRPEPEPGEKTLSNGLSPQRLADLWNERIETPKVRVLVGTRLAHARKRVKEHPDLAWWAEVVQRIAATPFLRGQKGKGWRASFDWLVANELNAIKVLEGKYDDAGPSERAPQHTSSNVSSVPSPESTREIIRRIQEDVS